MGCNSCEKEGRACDGGCDAGACGKGGKLRDKARIDALRACEPFCDNGCKPFTWGPTRSQLYAFLASIPPAKLALAGFTICTDPATGEPGVAVPGGGCIPLKCSDPCAEFGPHANAAVRDPDLSPTDIYAISKAFGHEQTDMELATDLTGFTNWYVLPVGALGVSHKFCLTGISAQSLNVTTGVITPQTVTDVRLAGARIVCASSGINVEPSPGSYVWAMDESDGADPGDIEVTPYRCVCKNLCAWTPAGGMEFVLFKLQDAVPGADNVYASVEFDRCDWMRVVDKCVSPKGNRRFIADLSLSANGLYFGLRRVTPGFIPLIP